MTLFGVLLKLIQVLTLTTSEEFSVLKKDTKDWEENCRPESESKVQQMYHKIHQGVIVRLLMPFLYFMLLSWASGLGKEEEDDL